jgi:hypothetical protein
MKQVYAAQLAEWIVNHTRGFADRGATKVYIEGTIDTYDLLVYVQSLLANRSTDQIHADNKASYTGRAVNAAVEGGDFMGG